MIKLVSHRSDIKEFEVGDTVEYTLGPTEKRIGVIAGFDSEYYSENENQQSPEMTVMIVYPAETELTCSVATMGSFEEPTIDDEKLLEGYEDCNYDWCEPKYLKVIQQASRIKTLEQILRDL